MLYSKNKSKLLQKTNFNMHKYIIFAGVNGAGKSTLYYVYKNFHNIPRINIDDIVKTFGSWKNKSDILKAGKIAIKKNTIFT